MGKLVVSEFITLDGVIEDPGGAEGFSRGGWAFDFDRGDEGERFKYDELMAAEVQLLGRVTYEGFARAWPSMKDTGDFGEKMNGMPKRVVSSTLGQLDWTNSTLLTGDLQSEVERLKATTTGDILVAGSARLVQGLTDLGLVDEYRLMVFPVLLGAGKRLFGETTASTRLALTGSQPAGECTILTYQPAPAPDGAAGPAHPA